MARIYFNSDRAWAQLQSAGKVVTLRKAGTKYPKKGVQVWRHGEDTEMRVNTHLIRYLAPDRMLAGQTVAILEAYVDWSGFDPISDWVLRAQELSGKQSEWGLWLITEDYSGTT